MKVDHNFLKFWKYIKEYLKYNYCIKFILMTQVMISNVLCY